MTALRVGWDLLAKKLKSLDRGAPTEWLDGQMVVSDRWQAAARDGDRRYDAAMRLAAYWRMTTVAAAAIGVGLAGGWWWEAQKPQVETVFVPFDRIGDPGEVFVARAGEPPDLMRISAADSIVKAMFALSSDDNVNADNQATQERVIRGDARKRFDAWREDSKEAASERQVLIVSTKLKSRDVVNVIWDELDWKDGRQVASRRVNGDFTLAFTAPRTTGDVVRNKSGLFLTHMIFAEER
ncbi:MAG: hypothetical protein IPK66_18950 [Rhodospirillales bacterium]|nr:hypothetical protein [Rhodospirillales bacterium]